MDLHLSLPCLYGTINKGIQSFQPPPLSWVQCMHVAAARKVLLVWPPPSPSCCSIQTSARMYGITDKGLDVRPFIRERRS